MTCMKLGTKPGQREFQEQTLLEESKTDSSRRSKRTDVVGGQWTRGYIKWILVQGWQDALFFSMRGRCEVWFEAEFGCCKEDGFCVSEWKRVVSLNSETALDSWDWRAGEICIVETETEQRRRLCLRKKGANMDEWIVKISGWDVVN